MYKKIYKKFMLKNIEINKKCKPAVKMQIQKYHVLFAASNQTQNLQTEKTVHQPVSFTTIAVLYKT